MNLAYHLIAILLAFTDCAHDVTRRHGNFSGVDTVRAVNRAASALGALVKVLVPVVQHLLVKFFSADKLRQILAGQRIVATIH